MCTERYVNPFTDFGFKLLFGTPANKEFLIMFLNSILDCDLPIVDISYNNTEVFGKTPDDRRAVYDLYCETTDGSHIIVEMQNAYQRFFLDRTIFYSSFPIQAAAKRGEWDYMLPPIYTVAFLNFSMEEYFGNPDYKHVCKLTDVATKQVIFDKLTYVYLEMPKFDKDIDNLNGFADCWLYIIKNLAKLNEKPKRFVDKVFERFFRVAEIARFTPEQRQAYETSLKIMRDYNNTINSAEYKGRKEGLAEGIEKGLAEGIEKGLAEGIEKGIEKGIEMERKKLAKTMLESGISAADVAKFTGLPESFIDSL